MVREKAVLAASLATVLCSTLLLAQAPATPPRLLAPAPWRFAGARACVGPEGGVLQCPPAPRVIAVRAGRLFDSITGQMLSKQVVLLLGERITIPANGSTGTAGSRGLAPHAIPRPAT